MFSSKFQVHHSFDLRIDDFSSESFLFLFHDCFWLVFSDQFRFVGNCPPTRPLTHHFAQSKNEVLISA